MDALGIPADSRFGFAFCEGELRNVRLGRTQILSRLYAAVRDENWGTVPMVQFEGEETEFVALHEEGSIRYRWQGSVVTHEDGFDFRFDGEALTAFRRCRIGFCLLFPATLAGTRCAVERTDREATGEFPHAVDPLQPVEPFTNLVRMTFRVPDGDVSFEFSGDEFEMEDQRNWTDASYKVFCTPLERPYPVPVGPGDRVSQEVRVRFRPSGLVARQRSEPAVIEVGEEIVPIPEVGSLEGDAGAQFIRIDADPEFPERFVEDVSTAEALGLPIELGLLCPGLPPRPIRGLFRVLAAPLHERLGTAPDFEQLAAEAARWGAPVALGTDSDYVFLNRHRPAPGAWSFSINPQVHAFDDVSIFETLSMHGVLVRDARAKGAAAVHVSPVTLRPRHNPYADVQRPREAFREDPREASLGEAWKMASLAALASAGAASITFGRMPVAFGTLVPATRWFRLMTPQHVYGLRWVGPHGSGAFLVNAHSEPREVSVFGNDLTLTPHSLLLL